MRPSPAGFMVLCSGIWLAVVAAGCDGRDKDDGGGGEATLRNGKAPDQGGRRDSGPEDAAGVAADELRFGRERERMVAQLRSSSSDAPITDTRVLDALLRVPRHAFVPTEFRAQSYHNTPLPIPESQTISQPYIVALMTQLLDLDGTERVLEVGTGSGYQAAILGELAAEVVTVEIRPKLLEGAKKTLSDLKARGILGYKKLDAVLGDGSKGYPQSAPYDAIIVTAAPTAVPVALLNQLKSGGRLVIPVGGDYIQQLQLIRKREDGSYEEQTIVPVRFVPLVGG